jgi:hypothetical protein
MGLGPPLSYVAVVLKFVRKRLIKKNFVDFSEGALCKLKNITNVFCQMP